jgi:hypothetical protein
MQLEQALEHGQTRFDTLLWSPTFFHPDYTVGTGFSPVPALGH